MRGTFTGGHILGIPIRISASWFIALAIATGLFGLRVYPDFLPESSAALHWALAFATALGFFLSILLHELGHAVMARAFGIPVRSITLFLLGGVAQITQEVKRPGAELLIAAIGPLVSLALGVLFLALTFLLGGQHHRTPATVAFSGLGLMNLSVGVFNLIPGFPMDGGRVFRALIWAVSGSYRWATRIAAWTGRGVAACLVLLGIATAMNVGGLPLRSDGFSGIWLILIGFFLDGAARGSLETQRLLEYLSAYRAGDLMQRDVPIVAAGDCLHDFLPQLLAARDYDAAFVAEYNGDPDAEDDPDGGRMIGMITRSAAVMAPERDRRRTTAQQLMLPAESMQPAAPEDDAASLLQRLEGEGLVALPVVAGGEVVGLIGRTNLLRLIERRGRR